MRVIRNAFNGEKPLIQPKNRIINVVCEHCGSEFEVDESEDDIKVGQLGLKYVVCPCCGKDCYGDCEELGEITLTKDNINYPQHFCDFRNGTKVSNDETTKDIREMIAKLETVREKDLDNILYRSHGDTFILVQKDFYDNCYNIMVAKNYSECNINFTVHDLV